MLSHLLLRLSDGFETALILAITICKWLILPIVNTVNSDLVSRGVVRTYLGGVRFYIFICYNFLILIFNFFPINRCIFRSSLSCLGDRIHLSHVNRCVTFHYVLLIHAIEMNRVVHILRTTYNRSFHALIRLLNKWSLRGLFFIIKLIRSTSQMNLM